MATYPTGVKTYASKSAGQSIQASHINDLQDEVTAIEDGLLNGTAPMNSSRATVASFQVAGNSTLTGTLQVTGTSTFTGAVQFAGNVTSSGQFTAPNQPAFDLLSTALITGTAGSTISVSFEQERLDQGGFHSTSANRDRATIPTGSSGLYVISAHVFALNFGAAIAAFVTKNGTRMFGSQTITSSVASASIAVSGPLRCDAGDILRLELLGPGASTWSAGSQAGGGIETRFSGVKVS